MHLERLAGIAATKVGIEDHLLILEMGVKVARSLEIGRRRSKLAQDRLFFLILDGRWKSVSLESPHLNPLGRPQNCKDAAASSVESRAR